MQLPAQPQSVNLLLLDDDEDDYLLTRRYLADLERNPYRLTWAANISQALREVETGAFDAVLVDYDLGAHSGLDFVNELKQRKCAVPTIMLTGRGGYEIDMRAMELGVTDYLVKNEVTSTLLDRSIRYAIAQKKIEETLRLANEHLEARVDERTQELLQKNQDLEIEMILREQTENELAEMQTMLLDRSEAERLDLARELHDGPMQELYGIIFMLSTLRIGMEDAKLNDELGAVIGQMNNVIRSLRTTAYSLRPPSLAAFGLDSAIRSHAEQFVQAHPEIHLRVEVDRDDQVLAERTRLALYRIYQMAMANIVRHAQASQVTARLRLADNHAVLEVADDGRGFQAPERWYELAHEGHLGLAGAAERAAAIGGRLDIRSAPGKGTLIRVDAPLG